MKLTEKKQRWVPHDEGAAPERRGRRHTAHPCLQRRADVRGKHL